MGISKQVRFSILERDGFTCQYCGKTASESELEVDHIIPGIGDHPDNLIAACIDCNRGKSGRLIRSQEDLSELKRRRDYLRERLSILKEIVQLQNSLLEQHNELALPLVASFAEEVYWDIDFAMKRVGKTIQHFLCYLSPEQIREAIGITSNKKKVAGLDYIDTCRYFAGVLKHMRDDTEVE